jgi:hypothetical protein
VLLGIAEMEINIQALARRKYNRSFGRLCTKVGENNTSASKCGVVMDYRKPRSL